MTFTRGTHRRNALFGSRPIGRRKTHEEGTMPVLAFAAPVLVAAIGYSFLYLLFGGGIGGAVLIFIVAKMLGK
jgi:hypothetical protein